MIDLILFGTWIELIGYNYFFYFSLKSNIVLLIFNPEYSFTRDESAIFANIGPDQTIWI